MRNLFYAATLSALTACGISEEDFSADYDAIYCETLSSCGGEFSCEETSDTATNAEDPMAACTFDKDAAEACLSAEWKCDDLDQVIIPAVCEPVWDCGTGSTIVN